MFQIVSVDELPSDQSVVKGRHYDAAIEANSIKEEALAYAEEMREKSRVEYELEKKRGYEDGLEDAKTVAAERMTETVAEAAKYFSIVEDRATQVVKHALRKIIGEMDNKELLVRSVRNALAWARSQSNVTLKVSTEQAVELRSRVEEITEDYPMIAVIDIFPDESLGPLDCILETEIGTVNAGIEVQLSAIEAALARVAGNRTDDNCDIIRGATDGPVTDSVHLRGQIDE